MKFWQKIYLSVIFIFLISFDTITYLSITKSYSLNRSEVYSATENERHVIQSSINAKILGTSSYYKKINAQNLKMFIKPYGDYYLSQKIYIELYLNNSCVYSNSPSTLDQRSELQINRGEKSTITRTVNGISYYFVTSYLNVPNSNIKFVYIKNIQSLKNFKTEMIWYAILSSSIVFLILSVLLLTILLKLTDPIRQLNQGAKEIASGFYHKRLEIKSKDEIGELTCNFNKMAGSVENHIQELSELTENEQQFITNLAHEMRTPITAILGYGESMKYANLSEDEREKALSYIISESQRMKNMAAKLMNLTSLKHEKIQFQKIDLEKIIDKVESSLSEDVSSKNIKVIKDFQESQILGDKDLIESMAQNLMENSVRALADGGEIEVKTFGQGERLTLSIADNGIGMSKNNIQKIFEPFYRVDKSRSRAYGGAGLGLALCKAICDLHDATINVRSEPNKGTKFIIEFTTALQPDDNHAKCND